MSTLLLPVVAAKNLSSGYRLPLLLQPYQVQGGKGAIVETRYVSIYVQALVVNGFTYGYHILQVKWAVRLRFICETGSGILHFPVKGCMNMRPFHQTTVLEWNKEQYGLGYHPAGSELDFYFEPGHYHFFQLAFSLNLLQQLLPSLPDILFSSLQLPGHPAFAPPLPVSKKLKGLVARALAQVYKASSEVLNLNNNALLLLSRYIQDGRTQERKQFWERKKEIQLAELETYIQDHLDTDTKHLLSLSFLARKTGTSNYNFKKLFRRHYGRSPAVYIQQKRMEKAMQLLTGSAMPAGDIYQQVGYENFSSFSRAFRAYHGQPPSYYRPAN